MSDGELGELGELAAQGELRSVRHVRRIQGSADEVWSALTDPATVAAWMLAERVVLEPRVGGEALFDWGDDGKARGLVTIFDPPRTLEYTWEDDAGASVVRFDLRPEEETIELVLYHRDLTGRMAAGVGAGWHAHLDNLMAMLAGEELDFWVRFRSLEPAYKEIADRL